MKTICALLSDQRGLATVEYALLLAFIGTSIAIAMAALAVAVTGRLDVTTSALTD
jgi:Flp pilus assembly pilin Flp